jgi:hypothetical protein
MSEELKNYNIYAGLGGSFGGAKYVGTLNDVTEKVAAETAYESAIEEYESYEGYHGIRDIHDIMEEEGVDEQEATDIYIEEREDWLDYYAIPADEDELSDDIFELN